MSNARFSVLILFYPFRSPRSNSMSEAAKCKCYITHVGNNLKNVGNNLRDRKVDQRGVNRSRLKFLAIGKTGLVPKYTPNPRVLGTVWSSYGGATPIQEIPRNKQDPTRKQTPKSSARNSKVYSTGWSDARRIEYVSQTDDTEPAAKGWAPVDPTYVFELCRFNRC